MIAEQHLEFRLTRLVRQAKPESEPQALRDRIGDFGLYSLGQLARRFYEDRTVEQSQRPMRKMPPTGTAESLAMNYCSHNPGICNVSSRIVFVIHSRFVVISTNVYRPLSSRE